MVIRMLSQGFTFAVRAITVIVMDLLFFNSAYWTLLLDIPLACHTPQAQN